MSILILLPDACLHALGPRHEHLRVSRRFRAEQMMQFQRHVCNACAARDAERHADGCSHRNEYTEFHVFLPE
ncbi:hypothetical protein [Breoghania sp.]|uniref:hypothetical protein n=1 Tax=Breoghania sp. TaxID=2065378 RepID=UPI00260A4C25|nr:hypothetical protein [Breoghania sp.]MDJ0932192.1 hypothetical protein [Breoghania sp.]